MSLPAESDWRQVVAACRHRLAQAPRDGKALRLLVEALATGGAEAEIVATLQPYIARGLRDAALACRYAAAASAQGDHATAARAYHHATRCDQTHVGARLGLARALLALGRAGDAATVAREAAGLQPDSPEAPTLLALALRALGQSAAALAAFRQAAELAPDEPRVLVNLGAALRAAGELEPARTALARARALAPDEPHAAFNEAHLRLLAGDFVSGLPLYERRWETGDFASSRRPFAQPLWRGEALGARTLLIHREQGVGDTLNLCRYLPLIAAHHPEARLLFEVQPSALTLLRHGFRLEARIAVEPYRDLAGSGLPAFDLQLPLASLPLACGTRADSIPATVPYLAAPAPRHYRQPGDQLVVGLSWLTRGVNAAVRSLALERLAPVLAQPGVRLLDLQYGDTAAERAALTAATGIALAHDPQVDALAELAGLADQVAGCNLVVSIDNATVHLAGALAVPCWVLLPYLPDWRWQLRREDSPWYPTLKLYRPPAPGAWEPLLQRVGSDLAALLAGDQTRLKAAAWRGPPAESP